MATQPVPKASFLSGRRGWIGGALAASVAVAALFVARPLSNGTAPAVPGAAPAQVAEASPAPAGAKTDVQIPKTPLAPEPAVDLGTAAVAAAEVPRRAIERRSSRSQSQRAALRASTRRESAPVNAVATAATPAGPSTALASDVLAPSANVATNPANPDPADPFRPQHGEAVARPWPRAVLPQYSSAGGINASYGASSPSFYPFEPSMPQEGAPATAERNPPPR